jgi:thimet oligopeptidase
MKTSSLGSIVLSTAILSALTLSVSCSTASHKAGDHANDLIRSDFDSGELAKLCQKAIDKAQSRMDAIAKVPPAQRTLANTLLEFETANADLSDETQPLTFMKYVSPVASTNAEGAKCEKDVGEFGVKTLGRRDLYDAIRSQQGALATGNPGASGADVKAEKRLMQKTLEAFENNGLKLPDDKLAEMTKLMAKLSDLQNQFSENLNNDSTTIEATASELDGATPDFMSRLKKAADGKNYVITTKASDYKQLMENVRSADVRKRMAIAYNNRQAEANTKLLEEAIQVRYQIAQLMGFKNWADFQLSHDHMAKDSATVLKFLNGLRGKLAKRARQDVAQLLKFKKTYAPLSDKVHAWDVPYLAYQLEKRDYALDNEKVREYFPSARVTRAMLDVYSELLGVRFEEVTGPAAHSWSPDVRLYEIHDAKSGNLIGHFYTDFIPRQGKYSHFASFNIINGRKLADGSYRKPISAIVGNFNPPAGAKPSLLDHDEVVTLFHEFGHIMHQTLTTAPYSSLSGSNTARDFVEAPSQMLENWPWEKKILARLSGHYLDAKKKLPEDLLKKLLAVRDYQQGYFYTRQMMLALTDMTYHTATGPVDTAKVYDELYSKLLGIDPVPNGHFPAGFGHLMGGYDAGYYGYLWSLVYATDMYTAFQKTSPLDARVGARYRHDILEPGNMQDGDVLLTKFLGRKSNNKAFFKKLHIR